MSVTMAQEEFSDFARQRNDLFFTLTKNGKDRNAEQKENCCC